MPSRSGGGEAGDHRAFLHALGSALNGGVQHQIGSQFGQGVLHGLQVGGVLFAEALGREVVIAQIEAVSAQLSDELIVLKSGAVRQVVFTQGVCLDAGDGTQVARLFRQGQVFLFAHGLAGALEFQDPVIHCAALIEEQHLSIDSDALRGSRTIGGGEDLFAQTVIDGVGQFHCHAR